MIEFLGVDAVNKGGELMMRSMHARLDGRVRLALGHWGGTFETRARLGLHQKVWLRRLGTFGGVPGALVPRSVRRAYGLVAEADVDAYVDAAGFAYSDQWGPQPIEVAARLTARRRRLGKRTVLMPQAFGPFAHDRSRSAVRLLVSSSELVYAREPESYAHLIDVVGSDERIRICPDFTIGLKVPPRPDLLPVPPQSACAIIPNYRMVDKGAGTGRSTYLGFLRTCIDLAERAALAPFFLIHETDRDLDLATEAVAGRARPVPVLRHDDPLAIKGAIAACQLVVGSRFHGLVSALSQGVPAVGAGWSHKYPQLFSSFGMFPDALIEDVASESETRDKLGRFLDSAVRNDTRTRLLAATSEQLEVVEQMWQTVESVLDVAPPA